MDDKALFYGKAVKSDGNKVAGYLAYFSPDPSMRDLDGEYFTKDTDFGLDAGYPVVGDRILFHHGAYKGIETKPVGRFTSVKVDDLGLWAEGVLDEANEYAEHIKRLVAQGKLSWSSGALPNSVITENGQIKRWHIIEGSLTPTPAMPIVTRVSVKSLMVDSAIDLFGEGEGDVPPAFSEVPNVVLSEKSQKESGMDVLQIIAKLVEKLAGSMSPEELSALVNEIAGVSAADVEVLETASVDDLAKDGTPAFKAMSNLTNATVRRVNTIKATAAAGLFADRAVSKNHIAGSAANAVGLGQMNPLGTGGRTPYGGNGVPVSIEHLAIKSRLSNMTAEQLGFALMFDNHLSGVAGSPRIKFDPAASNVGRNLAKSVFADAAINAASRGEFDLGENYQKAFTLREKYIKANETENTQATGFGEEWVPTAWSNSLWERARRENVVFPRIPQFRMSASVQYDSTEASDGTVYLANEETNAAQFADPTSNSSRIGTTNRTFDVTNKILQRKFLYSYEQIEEGLAFVEGQFEKQARRNMLDAFDDVILNGDTDTGNTNINNDGTPLASTDRRLIFDGLIDYALANAAVNMGAAYPTFQKIVEILYRLNAEIVGETANTVLFVEPILNSRLIQLPEFVTADKLGGAGASRTGVVPQIAGVDVLLSQQIKRSASNGKVNDTPGDNVYGRIVAAYLPYWKLGIYREIKSHMALSASGTQFMLTLTARMDLKQHNDVGGAALLYGNLV